MLRSVRFGVAVGLCVATSCGGESDRAERRVPVSVAGRAQAGKGGSSAGGCAACGAGTKGRGGTTGGGGGASSGGVGGASGSSGAGTGAGRAQGGTSSLAGATSAAAGAGGVSVSGSGGSDDAGKGASGGSAGGGSGGDTSAGMAGQPAFDDSLSVTKVAVYQAVESTLFEHGSAVTPNATIVADRELLLRVWLEPGKDFAPRAVTAELSITAGGSTDLAGTTHAVNGVSADDDLSSTVTFELNATDVTDTTLLSLVIKDAASAAELTRWPESGEQVLAASSSKGPFQITMVPLVAGGFAPDLSAGPLSRFSRYLGQLYPASSVELTVRDPVTLSVDVQPDGDGWDEALDALLAVRDADDPEPQVYYYGVLTPGATMDDYCSVDCVVGLSNVAGKTQAALRGAIGTGYFESSTDTFSQETFGHELGHALGREHSPCGGADYPDPDYPYRNAFTGVWGYGGRDLFDPKEYRDVMSYCEPVWISDYTWNAIFTRISYVNGITQHQAMSRSARPKQRTLIVGQRGLRWGSERSPAEAPDGEPVSLELLDEQGNVIDDILVPFAPFDHLPGGFLSVPVDALRRTGATSVRVGDATIAVVAD